MTLRTLLQFSHRPNRRHLVENRAERLFFNTKKRKKKQNEETHLYPRGNAHAVPLHHSLRRRPRNSGYNRAGLPDRQGGIQNLRQR